MKTFTNFSVFQQKIEHLVHHANGYRIFSSPKQPGIRAIPILLHSTCDQPLYIDKIFRGKVNSQYKYRQENSPYLGLEYVRAGSLAVRQNGHGYLIEPGEIFLIQPNMTNEIVCGPEGYCVKDSLPIRGRLLDAALEATGLTGVACISDFDWQRLDTVLDHVTGLSLKTTISDYIANSQLAYEILEILAYTRQHTQSHPRMAELVDYMKEHLSEPLNLRMLCAQIGCSETYLLQTFRTAYDQTPHQYLIEIRMAQAAHLLLSRPELSIKEIAQMVGYPNAMNFSTAFRQHYQHSPRNYRKIRHENILR